MSGINKKNSNQNISKKKYFSCLKTELVEQKRDFMTKVQQCVISSHLTHKICFCRILSDFVNSMQGLLVFIIFISNRKRREKVIDLLKKVPLPCCKKLNQVTPANDSHGSANWRENSSTVSLSGPSVTQGDISLQEPLNKTDKSDNKWYACTSGQWLCKLIL